MGALCSKKKRGKKGANSSADNDDNDPVRTPLRDDDFPDHVEDEEDVQEKEVMDNLRLCLQHNLDLFVMNNVLMSVQFFKNYEDEMEGLRQEARNRDGSELDGHRLKHCQGDRVMEEVGNCVVYRPMHGPQKNTEELLHPLRSFLVYQNIQVESPRGVHEDWVEKKQPYYKLRVEQIDDNEEVQLERAGYLNLKEIQSQHEEVIYESIDGVNSLSPASSRRSSMSNARPQYNSALRRNSTGYLVPVRRMSTLQVVPIEQLYAYTTIQSLTAPKFINNMRLMARPTVSCIIPNYIFTQVERQMIANARRTGNRGPLVTTSRYLNSAKFFSHFLDVLCEHLAQPLHLESLLANAPVQGGRVLVHQDKVLHHIMPVLASKFWPAAADEFLKPAQKELSWPTDHMKKKIRKMGMYILPLGHLKRRGFNQDFELQWQYICPRGEEYLLTRVMHAHMRCYLFTLTLIKAFLPTDNTVLGLNHSHILHILFWEVHKDFKHWSDDHPAENLIKFLNAIQTAIGERKIPDFFLHSRNILESSPILFLNRAEAVITRILENPLPYILLAFKNLRMRTSFYPTLDTTRIYEILTVKNILGYLYPDTVPEMRPKKSESDEEDEDDEDDERVWRRQYHKQLKIEKEAQAEEARRISVDSIKLDQVINKKNIELRQCALLDIFIRHNIEMSRKSREFFALDQAQFYLLQAKRLMRLIREFKEADQQEVAEYGSKIVEEEKLCGEALFKNDKNGFTRNSINNTESGRLSSHNRALPQTPDAESKENPFRKFTKEPPKENVSSGPPTLANGGLKVQKLNFEKEIFKDNIDGIANTKVPALGTETLKEQMDLEDDDEKNIIKEVANEDTQISDNESVIIERL